MRGCPAFVRSLTETSLFFVFFPRPYVNITPAMLFFFSALIFHFFCRLRSPQIGTIFNGIATYFILSQFLAEDKSILPAQSLRQFLDVSHPSTRDLL